MAAYVLVDMEVIDPARYAEYRRVAPATLAQFGGRFIVRGSEPAALEGEWPVHRVGIIEFPTSQQAQAWWDSPAYAAARRLRDGAAQARMLLLQGWDES